MDAHRKMMYLWLFEELFVLEVVDVISVVGFLGLIVWLTGRTSGLEDVCSCCPPKVFLEHVEDKKPRGASTRHRLTIKQG